MVVKRNIFNNQVELMPISDVSESQSNQENGGANRLPNHAEPASLSSEQIFLPTSSRNGNTNKPTIS